MQSIHFACAPLVFAGALLFVGASVARADDDCQKRTAHADHKLHEAYRSMGGRALTRFIGARNQIQPAPIAGTMTIAGGTKMIVSGVPNIGMTTIMITIMTTTTTKLFYLP